MKPGRNDSCPCGSGKKYKKCCHDNLEARSAFQSMQPQEEPSRQEIGTLVSLFNQQRYIEAEFLARPMTENFPHYGFGWLILGAASNRSGRSADALAALQKAATLLPRDEDVHYNLGSTFHNLCRLDKAAASYRRALALKPDYVEAHNNLGNILKDIGQLNEAKTSYLRALQIKPDYAEALCNLGNTLKELGRMAEAEASLRRALQIRPDFVEALDSLALLLNTQGESAMALDIIHQSMQYKETAEAKSIFVACAKHLRCTSDDSEMSSYGSRFDRALGAPKRTGADQRQPGQTQPGHRGMRDAGNQRLACAAIGTKPVWHKRPRHPRRRYAAARPA